MPNWTRWLLVSVAVVGLDQISKAAISQFFVLGDSVRVTSFFNLVLAYNTGAAFSFLAAAGGWQRFFFAGIAVLASVIIIHMLRRGNKSTGTNLALALILGGAVGNLVDRVLLGHVVDFVQLHAAGFYWPAFNVADSAITMGAFLLVWDSFRRPAVRRETR